MLQISVGRNWHHATKTILDFSQLLTQAMLPGQSPLLQLPYVSNETIQRISKLPKKIHTIKEFLEMEDSKRREIVGVSAKEYELLLQVASKFPRIHIHNAEFRVPGEPFIVPSSLVTLTVKFSCLYGTENAPSQNEELPPLESNSSKSKNKWWQHENTGEYAHTFLPISTRAIWQVSLSNTEIDRLICCRNVVGNNNTLHMEFQAPPEPGSWKFTVSIKSNTFVNSDIVQSIKLVVKQPTYTAEINDKEFESSSDEEEAQEIIEKRKTERKKKQILGEFEDSDFSDCSSHGEDQTGPEDFVD